MTFLTRLSIAEILNKYDFTQEEQEDPKQPTNFHANTTSIVQPMDQGTILSFKCAYRRLLSQSLVNKATVQIENDQQIASNTGVEIVQDISTFKINKYIQFSEAIEFFIQAWNSVTQCVLQNSWLKSGIPAIININKWSNVVPTYTNIDQNLLADEKLLFDFQRIDSANNICTIQQQRHEWEICDTYLDVEDALEAMEQTCIIRNDAELRTCPPTGDLTSDVNLQTQINSILDIGVPVTMDIAYREYL